MEFHYIVIVLIFFHLNLNSLKNLKGPIGNLFLHPEIWRYGSYTVVLFKMYYINSLKQELSTAKACEHKLLDERYVIDRHRSHRAAKFGVIVDKDHYRLRSHKLHITPYVTFYS